MRDYIENVSQSRVYKPQTCYSLITVISTKTHVRVGLGFRRLLVVWFRFLLCRHLLLEESNAENIKFNHFENFCKCPFVTRNEIVTGQKGTLTDKTGFYLHVQLKSKC